MITWNSIPFYIPLHEAHTVSIPPSPLPPLHFLLQDYLCRTTDMSCGEEREGGKGERKGGRENPRVVKERKEERERKRKRRWCMSE